MPFVALQAGVGHGRERVHVHFMVQRRLLVEIVVVVVVIYMLCLLNLRHDFGSHVVQCRLLPIFHQGQKFDT